MAILFTIPLRIAQTVFAIVVLGLTAYGIYSFVIMIFSVNETIAVANWWGGFYHALSPTEVNFLIFSSVWSLLALVYLVVAPWKFPDAAHKFGILAAEAVTMIFWFAGFIALAVFLSDRVCYGHVCNAAKAAAAFAAFEW